MEKLIKTSESSLLKEEKRVKPIPSTTYITVSVEGTIKWTSFLFRLGTQQPIMGVVQLVVREENGELLALADYRKGGVAAGYR